MIKVILAVIVIYVLGFAVYVDATTCVYRNNTPFFSKHRKIEPRDARIAVFWPFIVMWCGLLYIIIGVNYFIGAILLACNIKYSESSLYKKISNLV
jgi:hypothetical protein